MLIQSLCFIILSSAFADVNSTTTSESNQVMLEQIDKTNTLLQKINENLNQTNVNIINLKNSEEINSINTAQLDFVRFQVELLATFVAALFGVSVGLFGDRIRDWRIEQGKIKKVKDLLKDDISRISNNVNVNLLHIEKLFSKLRVSDNIERRIITTKGLVEENIAQILVNIRLLHWNAIVNSGYLIKLKTDEIRDLQSLQNYLEDTRKQMIEYYKLKTDDITLIALSQDTQQNKVLRIKNQLKYLAEFFHMTYPKVSFKLIKIQNEIDWLSNVS